MKNSVFIATSLDGYIADQNGAIDWLYSIENPNNSDMGYAEYFEKIDALVMGRNTFEVVMGFDCDWPYSKPVFVLTNTLKVVPKGFEDKISFLNGSITDIVSEINAQGYKNLYIDGGLTIQQFLKADLIDEMIITTIPVLLGGGSALFGHLDSTLNFKHTKSTRYCDAIVQNNFTRVR